jgi:hypothetical protein
MMTGWGGLSCRGDIDGPWEWVLYGEKWLKFDRAIIELGDKLAIPPSVAEAKLHKLCASGGIRAVGTDEPDELKPQPIPPSEWPIEHDGWPRMDVLVSNIDFYNWLNQQISPAAGGKQSRIIRLLAEMFPTGVPNRAERPRQPLIAELVKRDPSLKPLDFKTLKTAIEACNRQLGNTRNTGVSD